MLTKRIIPCLDIKDGRTVKGINFENIRDAGDPVELGALYARQGADELVFLDITATVEKRKTLSELVKQRLNGQVFASARLDISAANRDIAVSLQSADTELKNNRVISRKL